MAFCGIKRPRSAGAKKGRPGDEATAEEDYGPHSGTAARSSNGKAGAEVTDRASLYIHA